MLVYKIPLLNAQEVVGNVIPSFNLSGESLKVIDILPAQNRQQLNVETNWHTKRYGFDIPASDIANYHLHYTAWQSFKESKEEWCMIVDASVKIETDIADILLRIQALPDEWDVYFPFDRFRIHEKQKELIRIHNQSLLNPNKREYNDFLPFVLGFEWGNSIYFLSRKGVDKLLLSDVVKQRVDDEIISLSIRKQIDAFFDDVSWFDYEHQPKVVSKDRDNDILNTIMKNSRWSVESKDQIRRILGIMSEVGEKLNIDLVLQGGSHLGYIRHGGIMPWDDDVDLGIEERYLETFLAEIQHNTPLKHGRFIEESTGFPFYKIWLEDTATIEEREYKFPFVDLWMFNVVKDDLVFWNGIICPNSARYPLENVCFEGVNFKMTANSMEVLDSRYRTWRNGIRVYNYHHSLEQSIGFSLRVPVALDENGRIILPHS